MTGYVVDASVAVKWLVSEAFSDEAAGLLDNEATLIAPDLLFAEATNALWAMCRQGDINRADYAEAVGVLKSAPVAVPVPMRQLAGLGSAFGDRPRSSDLRLLLPRSRRSGATSGRHRRPALL
jgi:hypothetical protein